MKNLLLISILFVCFCSFGQSKRKINEQLIQQLEQLDKTNVSLLNEFYDKHTTIENLRSDIYSLSLDLKQLRTETENLRYEIRAIKSEMLENGDNPEQFVSENELNVIWSLVSQTDYQKEAEKVVDTSKFLVVKPLSDLSRERIKTRNELLNAKIIELKGANEENAAMLLQLKTMLEKLGRIKTTAKDQLGIAAKMKSKLEEKRTLLVAKENELADKRYDEQVKKLMEEANKASKKKKSTTVKFIPPVIQPDRNVEDNFPNLVDIEDDVSKEWENEAPTPMQLDTIVYFPDQMPEFPSGMKEAFQKYLRDNLKYPQAAVDAGIQGKVYMQFLVTSTGSIVNVNVAKGIPGCPDFDMEAFRVISQMPNWKPAMNNGKAVPCYYTIPIIFKLDQ